jgi:ribosome-associated protein
MNVDINKLLKEVRFNFSRSGGKGGQNVNKVETKAELTFNIYKSNTLSVQLKELLLRKLKRRLTSGSVIRIVAQSERTQLGNRKAAEDRFEKIIMNALQKEKVRAKTKASRSSNEKRLEHKKLISHKKKMRNFPMKDSE